MPVEVRVLTIDDATRIAASRNVFDDAVIPVVMLRFLNDPRHHIIGALDGDTLVGFVSAVHYDHPDKPAPEFWLNEVGVAETHQRQGIAQRLMTETLALARQLGCSAAWVITGADNTAANQLYAGVKGAEAMRDQVMYTFPLA
jgi:ribosomal protein S18 acetylase RimI-like enzyme